MKHYTCRRVVIRTAIITAVAFAVQLRPSHAQIRPMDLDDVLRSSEHVVDDALRHPRVLLDLGDVRRRLCGILPGEVRVRRNDLQCVP